ncbi:MAG: response regulator, partial [Deltaproteobacteria bacterium]|nr:response regulator [Deltaproteobacteria bacterium]
PMRKEKLSKNAVMAGMAGLIIMTVILYLAYLDHKNFEQSVVSQTQQQLLTIAKSAARSLEEFVKEHSESLKTISRNPSLQEEVYRKVLHRKPDNGYCLIKTNYEVHRDDTDALTTLDANGIMLHRHPFIANRHGMDHTDKPGVACVVQEHKLHVSEVFYNNLGNFAISISEPVFYKDEFAGIVRWMIQIDTISKRFIQTIQTGKEGYAWIFDEKNVVLSHPEKEFVGMSILDVIRKMHTERSEIFDESRLKEHIREEHDYLNRVKVEDEGSGIFIDCTTGKNDLVAFKRIAVGDRNWNLILTLPYHEIAGPIKSHARNTFGLAGLVIVLFGTGGVLLFKTREKKARLETKTKYLKKIAGSAEALRRSEEKLSGVIDSVTDCISMVDEEFTIVWVNDVTKRLFGSDLIGKKCYNVYRRRDSVCEQCSVKRCFEDGKIHHHETEVVAADGGQRSFWCTASVAEHYEDGRPRMVVEIARDITERKKLEAQLFQAQKMEAIGTLAGGIAHDFNNILAVIQGDAQLISLDLDHTNPHYELVKEIENRVEIASNLTRQLLGFARGGKYEVRPFNLNDMVRESSTAFGRTKKGITINLKLQEDLPPIEADTGQLEQVLMNLYVNAGHAMPDGGNLYLETCCVSNTDIQGKLFSGPCDYVLLSVGDTGIGMDKETRERIFDPFFTTKEKGRGTGLGLASVYGIIKNHKGIIDVESEKGQGTTFKIYLPASKREVESPVKVADQVIKGTETILLVDDEGMVLTVADAILNSIGYNVLKAKNGREALDLYKTNRDKIDLIILDIIMPDMGGGKTYDLLKAINPDIKVLLSSGYSADNRVAAILDRGAGGFIQKPFSVQVLSHKIREVLER